MQTSAFDEKRRAARATLFGRITLDLPNGRRCEGQGIDIGVGGCSAMSSVPLKLAQPVEVTVTLSFQMRTVALVANAHVIWCVLSRGQYRIGVAFVGLDAHLDREVKRYIDEVGVVRNGVS